MWKPDMTHPNRPETINNAAAAIDRPTATADVLVRNLGVARFFLLLVGLIVFPSSHALRRNQHHAHVQNAGEGGGKEGGGRLRPFVFRGLSSPFRSARTRAQPNNVSLIFAKRGVSRMVLLPAAHCADMQILKKFHRRFESYFCWPFLTVKQLLLYYLNSIASLM